jgi:hypothetical protein
MSKQKHFEYSDDGAYTPYPQSDELVPPRLRQIVFLPESQRKGSIKTIDDLFHRVPNGRNDPMSVLCVLNILQRWSPEYWIRSKYATIALNERHRTILFDAMTVGHIIGELAEIGKEAYTDRPDLEPIMGSRNYKGNYWFINNAPTTYAWFWKLRGQLVEVVRELMRAEANGGLQARPDSVWSSLDYEAVTK